MVKMYSHIKKHNLYGVSLTLTSLSVGKIETIWSTIRGNSEVLIWNSVAMACSTITEIRSSR